MPIFGTSTKPAASQQDNVDAQKALSKVPSDKPIEEGSSQFDAELGLIQAYVRAQGISTAGDEENRGPPAGDGPVQTAIAAPREIPLQPPRPVPKHNVDATSRHHLHALARQCLTEVHVSDIDTWEKVLTDVASEIAQDLPYVLEVLSRPAAQPTGHVAPLHHSIKISLDPDGEPLECHYVPGPPDGLITPEEAEQEPRLLELGGTVVLKGTVKDLRKLEKVMELIIFVACNLKLEMYLLEDHFVARRPLSSIVDGGHGKHPDGHRQNDGRRRKRDAARHIWNWIRGADGGSDGEEGSQIDVSGRRLSAKDSIAGQSEAGDDADGRNRFDRAIKQISKTIISASPDVTFPPPHLLVRLRNEEKDTDPVDSNNDTALSLNERDLRRSYAVDDVDFLTGGGRNGRQKLGYGSGRFSSWGAHIYAANRKSRFSTVASRNSHISVDSRAGLGCLQTNNNSIVGVLRHQSISFAYSYHLPTYDNHHVIPCRPPEIVTIEYYQKATSSAHQDRTLGQFVELLAKKATGTCPDGAMCGGKTMGQHVITYTHNTGRISVTSQEAKLVLRDHHEHDNDENEVATQAAGKNNRIYMWTACIACNAATHIIPMSLASWNYSLAKYLELLYYNPYFIPTLLCDHVAGERGREVLRRCFRYRDRIVIFGYDQIDLFEMRLPKIQISPDHHIEEAVAAAAKTNKLLGSATNPESHLLDTPATESPRDTQDGDSSSNTDNTTESDSDVDIDIDIPAHHHHHPHHPHHGTSAVPDIVRILDDLRLEITYFYGSLFDHIKKLQDATGYANLVTRNQGTPDQVRCQLMLDEMWRRYKADEEALFDSIVPCVDKMHKVNDVRKRFLDKIDEVIKEIGEWTAERGVVDPPLPTPDWQVPEYCKALPNVPAKVHVYPNSFVLVREDEPTSIIAFTLSSKDYIREARRRPPPRLADEPNDPSTTTTTALPTTPGAELHNYLTPQPSPSRGNGPAAEPRSNTASPLAASSNPRPQWRNVDADYVVKVIPFSHESASSGTSGDATPHIKFKFRSKTHHTSLTSYYYHRFSSLRRKCSISSSYITSLSRCSAWESVSGGKSRAAFFKTLDETLVIKELTGGKWSWGNVEKGQLLKFAPKYLEYMERSDKNPTVLVKIFGFYTIKRKNVVTGAVNRLDVLVMEHLFANVNISRKFDLKGIPDRHIATKHRTTSTSNLALPDEQSSTSSSSTTTSTLVPLSPTPPTPSSDVAVLWDGEWVSGRYTQHIRLHGHSKQILTACIASDTAFLASANIMDYSLLVGVNDARKELVVGIVDFVGSYTWYKSIESKAKTTISGVLAMRGSPVERQDGSPVGELPAVTILPPDLYAERFRRAMEQNFLMVPDKWIKIPTPPPPLPEKPIPTPPSAPTRTATTASILIDYIRPSSPSRHSSAASAPASPLTPPAGEVPHQPVNGLYAPAAAAVAAQRSVRLPPVL